MSPIIQVFLKDVASGNLFELPFTSISFIDELNAGKQATFNFDFMAMKDIASKYSTTVVSMFTSSLKEIWVTMNGTTIWLGVVSEYDKSRDSSANYTLSVAAIDYFALFQKRRTGLTEVDFSAVDPATIPWSLINTSQGLTNGSYGITQGATASTGLSVTVAYKNSEIRQEIIKLSNAQTNNSFDFDIDFTKKFNVYYPTKGSVRSNIVLDDNNILANSVKIPLVLSLTNSVFVTGQGINNDQAAVNRQASAYQTAYGLLEDVTSDINISDTNLLNALGDRFLALNEQPLYQISLKHDGADPDITTFDVGDTIIVNLPDEAISYSQYRVKKRTVDIDQSGQVISQIDLLLI